MRLEFAKKDLERAVYEPDFIPRGWSKDLLRIYRKRIQFIESASDERDLRAMASLHLEKLKGDRANQWSIRLNKKDRLIVKFRTEAQRIVIVIEVVDYHR